MDIPVSNNNAWTLLFYASIISLIGSIISLSGIVSGLIGDVMADSLVLAKKIAGTSSDILSKLNLSAQKYLLATVHRAENTDNENRLLSILTAFNKLKEKIIFPVHPRTKKIIKKLGFKFSPHVISSEPLGYSDMIGAVSWR